MLKCTPIRYLLVAIPIILLSLVTNAYNKVVVIPLTSESVNSQCVVTGSGADLCEISAGVEIEHNLQQEIKLECGTGGTNIRQMKTSVHVGGANQANYFYGLFEDAENSLPGAQLGIISSITFKQGTTSLRLEVEFPGEGQGYTPIDENIAGDISSTVPACLSAIASAPNPTTEIISLDGQNFEVTPIIKRSATSLSITGLRFSLLAPEM